MPRIVFTLVLFLQVIALQAQKLEEGFDYAFKHTDYAPRYFVSTEKKDGLWHRQAFYLPERTLAMEGWYKDRECKTAHGVVSWYHPNKYLKSEGRYVDGAKEGLWLGYDEAGILRDSTTYVAGKLKGTGLHWYADGMPSDSMQFDGAGNGAEVTYFEDGTVASAGLWVSDTAKNGRWKYYAPNGTLRATEDYAGGKRMATACFDESGKALDSAACAENEADFPGGVAAWTKFIQRNLKADVPVKLKAPVGQYTVVLQFIVAADGRLEGIKPVTHFGFGMEEEVERLLKTSPRWKPAQQFGRNVKAYRKQPITFVISNG